MLKYVERSHRAEHPPLSHANSKSLVIDEPMWMMLGWLRLTITQKYVLIVNVNTSLDFKP